MVGERLHAVVLAAAAGVPSVMLEYQPKCLDFMESIGRTDWCVRTDRVTGPEILERIEALSQARSDHVVEIVTAVGELRRRLAVEVARVRGVVGLDPAAPTDRPGAARAEAQ